MVYQLSTRLLKLGRVVNITGGGGLLAFADVVGRMLILLDPYEGLCIQPGGA